MCSSKSFGVRVSCQMCVWEPYALVGIGLYVGLG